MSSRRLLKKPQKRHDGKDSGENDHKQEKGQVPLGPSPCTPATGHRPIKEGDKDRGTNGHLPPPFFILFPQKTEKPPKPLLFPLLDNFTSNSHARPSLG